MAKKKKIDYDKYAAGLFTRTEQYADKVRQHYATAVDELLKLTSKGDLGSSGAFSFGDNTKLSEKANSILRGLYSAVYNEIKGGVASEWEYANLSCDALIESIFGKGLKEDNHFARWFSRNQEAMDSFFKRKSAYGGLNLSQDVWKYVGNLKTEMEVALTVSLGQGDSAATVSRKVRRYLENPDDMFRRFRVKVGDEDIIDKETGEVVGKKPIFGRRWKRKVINPQTGEVTWENFNPRNYHPGKGIYRSSYKNAMRLTRTETNMAYRSAEQDRWQNMDFVLGYRVKRSNNHPDVDICDDLSAANDDNTSNKGVYPKTFVFKGWHPQCRCFVVPILASRADFIKMQKALLNGEEPPQPRRKIEEPNEYFNKWVGKNRKRIENAKTLPYFIADNKKVSEKIIQANTPATLAELDDAIKNYQYINKALQVNEDEINSRMKKLFDENDFGMDIKHEYLENVYEKGFLNTFETGTSLGYNGSTKTTGDIEQNHLRLIMSHRMFLPSTSPKISKKQGSKQQYTGKQLQRSEYEKYGHLLDRDKAVSYRLNKSGYGDVQVRFHKDKVLTTWTFDDSLHPEGKYFQPSLTSNPQIASFNCMCPAPPTAKNNWKSLSHWQDEMNTCYIELQYHGKLTIEAVKSMTFNGNPERYISQGLIKKLMDKGIELWYIEDRKAILYQP
jgi:hypothetical protein